MDENTALQPPDSGSAAPVADAPRWRDLREWLDLLRRHDLLLTIDAEVDPEEELGAVTFMTARQHGAPALLFENLKNNRSDARILSNMLGASKERYALAVGLPPGLSTAEMVAATRKLMKRRLPPIWIGKDEAPVNEIVARGEEVDLTRLPVPKFWPGDGGRFLGTGDITLTSDPETGRINVGVYRQMLHAARRIGLNFVAGRDGLFDVEGWWARGRPCEVVVAYGIDPVLFMAGAQRFAAQESELDVAGGLMGRRIELTKAEFVSLPIPARAELVIEGVLHQGDAEVEGPLGEFHGFYSGSRLAKPVIEVLALHSRRAPILTAALMANYPAGEIGAYHAIMRSARILENLEQMGVPGIQGVYVQPAAASAMCMVVVALKQLYPGHAAQVLALTAQCPAAVYCTKWIIAVDEDVDPTDFDQVMWALSTRCNPADDLDVLRNTWTFRADSSLPAQARPYGSKVLINACKPHRYLKELPVRTLLRRSTYDQVKRRWAELGLPGSPPAVASFYEE
ncbi:MAG TPA: UbiD family decarboxylase [Stellaceae bacterium]|nr:UbiD family decarboxylase [Stellaceae bacterium]